MGGTGLEPVTPSLSNATEPSPTGIASGRLLHQSHSDDDGSVAFREPSPPVLSTTFPLDAPLLDSRGECRIVSDLDELARETQVTTPRYSCRTPARQSWQFFARASQRTDSLQRPIGECAFERSLVRAWQTPARRPASHARRPRPRGRRRTSRPSSRRRGRRRRSGSSDSCRRARRLP
jgi:hypothetical protein